MSMRVNSFKDRKISLARLRSSLDQSSANADILFETRALSCTTWLTFLGVASWLTSISSDYWVIIVGRNHGFELQDAEHLTFLWSYSGLWRRCDVLTHRENLSDIQTKCHDHQEHDHRENLIKDGGMDFIHAELTCVVIVVAMILVSSLFSLYALIHPRYVYKRLSGVLHIMTTLLVMIVIEMVNSEIHIPFHVIDIEVLHHADLYYGYSFLLAWTTFIVYFVAGLAFLCLSKKRRFYKHDFNNMLKGY